MDRRNFLTMSATSAVTLTALPGTVLGAEGPPPGEVEPPVAVDMEAYVARVDAGMARIAQWSPTADLPDFEGDREQADQVVRASLQSLFITGMLGDLAIPQQLDTRMQERVERALPAFDQAVDGMSSFLASRTEEDLRQSAALLRNPGAARGIVDALDAEASLTGVSPARRRQLREMLEHITWRLAHQPPSLLINEYLDKVERAADTDLESEARQRSLAARVGEEVFWRQDEDEKKYRRRSRGARVLGIGVIVFAVSGGLVAAGAFPAVFGMTVGAIMVLVGLVMYMSGASRPKAPADTTQPPGGAR